MARASNPGVPQRVSAHVVPKAASFSSDDEEKTTIESGGWEEEASTTVEQGEVADKVRALGLGGEPAARSNTAITSTDGNGVSDEPTVDDQRASVALAMLPPPSLGRLVVTGGGDTGRLLEVRPGRTYTIGRGIDNDLVLTDITASRKHFDLRNENGSWILADRGSGNGTLINNRIEDAPFMLASGDRIEVGNTAFRFDLVTTVVPLPGLPRELPARVPNGRAPASGVPSASDTPDSSNMPTPSDLPPPRELVTPLAQDGAAAATGRDAPDHRDGRNGRDDRNGRDAAEIAAEIPSLVPTFDGSVDDDLELSTLAGKPMHDPEGLPTPVVTTSRPKTLPPPAPLPRPRTQTGRPSGYALDRPGPRSQAMAAVTQPAMPPTALTAIAPTISPMHGAPLLPQPATTLPLPQMANRPPLSPALLDPPLASAPATLPGQGPPVPARGPRLPFAYVGSKEVLAPHTASGSRPPLQVTPGHPPRDATTALVQPMSYSNHQAVVAAQPPQPAIPPLSRRAKIALGLIGLAMFAAIAVIAIVKGVSRSNERGDSGGTMLPTAPTPAPAAASKTTTPSVTPIPTPPEVGGAANPARPTTDKPATPAPPSTPDKPTPPATTANAATSPPSGATASPPGATASRPSGATVPAPPRGPTTPPTDPAAPQRAPAGPPASSPPDRITAPPATTASAPTTPGSSASTPPPAVDPRPTAPDVKAPDVKAPDAKVTDRTSSTPGTARARTQVEANATSSSRSNDKKVTKRIETRRPERRPEPPAPTRSEKKRGRGTQDIKAEANALYKAKNFSGAASLLTSSLSQYSSEDAKELRTIAAIYSQLGKAYNVGMAPGTKPTEAYQALRRAIAYDHDVGSAYITEMQRKLVDTATRAASYYMADREYELAFQAVRMAEAVGSTSKNNQTVRRMLEEIAADLYREGQRELATDPEVARKKLRQILGIVESNHPLYGKAQKLLNAP